LKRTVIIILVLIPLSVLGQGIIFSPEILNTNDPKIEAVRDLWKSYVSTCENVDAKPSLEYWNKSEIDQGFTDIIMKVISTLYLAGQLIVSDIKKVYNDYYRIHNVWFLGDSTYLFKFNVYARKEVNSYKLYNSFFVQSALKISGPKKVLELLRYPINDQYSFEDAKSTIHQE
jgi:hypothetical protein